ncbi:MAG: DnaD domain protein [Tenericutes bacterium]|nr:DnaD domain protein [Mycoplasmatota bacterium]
MFNKVNNLIKGKDLIISNILFYNYEKLELNFEDLYYLTYLMNNSLEFDISKICSDLNKKPKDIIKVINKLDEMDILDIEIIKKDENDIKEIISLEKLYKKLTFLIVEKEDKIEEKVDLENEFKDVFKRDLTPREKQILNAWKSVGYNDLFILEGLKEAKYNGELSVAYIDNVLDRWQNQGITSKEDVIKSKTIDLSKPIESDDVIEVDDDYDWMNE